MGLIPELGLSGGDIEVVEVQRQSRISRTLPNPDVEHPCRSPVIALSIARTRRVFTTRTRPVSWRTST